MYYAKEDYNCGTPISGTTQTPTNLSSGIYYFNVSYISCWKNNLTRYDNVNNLFYGTFDKTNYTIDDE